MKKYFLSFILAFVALSLAVSHAYALDCTKVYESAKDGNFKKNDYKIEDIDKFRQSEIIVILTESIEKSGVSCTDIIQCLRQDMTKKDGFTFPEASIGKALSEQFPFCVVSGTDGLDLLSNYASTIYKWIAGLVGAICILIIIFSGIQISMGGLSQEEISSSKDRITRSLIGLAVLFLSAFILYTINPTFFT